MIVLDFFKIIFKNAGGFSSVSKLQRNSVGFAGWELEISMVEDPKPFLSQSHMIYRSVILDDGNLTAPQESNHHVYHLAYSSLSVHDLCAGSDCILEKSTSAYDKAPMCLQLP